MLAALGGTLYALVKKHPAGLLAGLVACSAVAGISYRAAILPNPVVDARDGRISLCPARSLRPA